MVAKYSSLKRVAIVDDSSVMRAMLCEIFSERAGYAVVGLAKNAMEAVSLDRELRPDLIAIDLMMPYIDGAQLLAMLGDRLSLVKIVLSSKAVASEQMRSRLLGLGAGAFFDKREIAADPERFRQDVAGLLIGRALRRRSILAGSPSNVIDAGTRFARPRDEAERLALLSRLGVANADPDYCLDILVRHLASQTGFPIVAVTLVDEERVWVKAGVGVCRTALPREDSVCSRALCDAKPTIISDMLTSPLTRDLPKVAAAPHYRSYAGVPIVSKSGVALGMMCLIDMRPRQPTPLALKSLVEAAALAALFIEDMATGVRAVA